MTESVRDVIILGSGPAGLTAGIYAARAQLNPLIAHGHLPGGQLTTTTEVENYPGFPEGIRGPALMESMRKQAERFGAEFVQRLVTKVEVAGSLFRVSFDDNQAQSRALIVATGATPRTLGLNREKEMMGWGLSTCATCDGAFFSGKEIVVIGGGDSACEEALFLTKFGSRVRLVHRRDQLRASRIMANRVLDHPRVEVIWNSVLVEILGDQKTGLTGGVFEDTVSKTRTTLECSAIFYAIGHTPNSSLFRGILDMDENGYILTAVGSTKTSVTGIFACGDVQDHVYRQAVTAAGSGCMASIEVERFLAGH